MKEERHDDGKGKHRSDPDGRADGAGDCIFPDSLLDFFRSEGQDQDFATESGRSGRACGAEGELSEAGNCLLQRTRAGQDREEVFEEPREKHQRNPENRPSDSGDPSRPEDAVGVGARVPHDGGSDDGAENGREDVFGDGAMCRRMAGSGKDWQRRYVQISSVLREEEGMSSMSDGIVPLRHHMV